MSGKAGVMSGVVVLGALIAVGCLVHTAQADIIIADWQFNEGGLLVDSVGGHTLVNSGTTVTNTGGIATFDGGGLLQTADPLDLRGVQKVRISWSMLATTDTVGVVWNHGWNAGAGDRLLASVNEVAVGQGTVGVHTAPGGYTSDVYQHSHGVNNATWENWSAEYDTTAAGFSGAVRVFKDGTEVGWNFNSAGGVPTAFGNFVFDIGALAAAGNVGFTGKIDRLTIESLPVPEPGTLTLLSCSLAGLLAYAWRRRRT